MAVLDTWTRLHIPNKTEDNTKKTIKLMPWYEAISTHGRHVWTTLGFASPPGPSDSLPSACCWASSRPCASYSPSIELDELADVVPVLGLRINWGQHTHHFDQLTWDNMCVGNTVYCYVNQSLHSSLHNITQLSSLTQCILLCPQWSVLTNNTTIFLFFKQITLKRYVLNLQGGDVPNAVSDIMNGSTN